MTYYCAITLDGRYFTMNGYEPSLTAAKGLARILPDKRQMELEVDLASRILGEPLSVHQFAI